MWSQSRIDRESQNDSGPRLNPFSNTPLVLRVKALIWHFAEYLSKVNSNTYRGWLGSVVEGWCRWGRLPQRPSRILLSVCGTKIAKSVAKEWSRVIPENLAQA